MIIATDFIPYWQITMFRTKDNSEVLFAKEEKKAPIAYRVLSERDKVPVNRKVLRYGGKCYRECENPLKQTTEKDRMPNEVESLKDYPDSIIIGRMGISEAKVSETFFDTYISYRDKFYKQV